MAQDVVTGYTGLLLQLILDNPTLMGPMDRRITENVGLQMAGFISIEFFVQNEKIKCTVNHLSEEHSGNA
jgi:hypothetical protein